MGPLARQWRRDLLPACVAAVVAAGFAVVSLTVGWQRIPASESCRASPEFCDSHPVAQMWGVIGAAVLAAGLVASLVQAAGGGASRRADRRRFVWTAAVIPAVVALALAVTATTRAWTSHQLLPGFGGAAATVSVIAAAAAGLLALWALVGWPASRRAALGLGVAVAVIAAGTMTAATAGWDGLSLDATTAPAVPAPRGPVATAPSRLLWDTQGDFQLGDEFAEAGGLAIEAAYADDRAGVEAVDMATGQVRWQYLRGDGGDGDLSPTAVMSSQAVGLFYGGLPAVFLNAATGRPEPLTGRAPAVVDGGQVGQAMLGSTYVQVNRYGQSGEVMAISAVTGQRLWADRVPDCPVFGAAFPANDPGAAPTVVQAGSTIAVLYQCQRNPHAQATLHLALFGPSGSQRDVTIGSGSVGGPDGKLAVAGSTVLVSAAISPKNIAVEQVAVDADTGAVLWTKPYPVAAVLGGGQVVLTLGSSLCGRYAVGSGRLLAEYPASVCELFGVSVSPAAAADGRVYLSQTVGSDGELVLPGLDPDFGKTRLSLKVVTVDASDGAILATRLIQLPAWTKSDGFAATSEQVDGNALITFGLDGNAGADVGFDAFAVR